MLAKNAVLEQIAERLGSTPPDWSLVVARFKRTETFKTGRYDMGLLYSNLSRLITRVTLAKLRVTLRDKLLLDPVKSGCRREGFTFLQKEDGLHVMFPPYQYVRLDELILADGLPALIETKLDPYSGRRGHRRRVYQSHPSEAGVINGKLINGLTKPITALFGRTDCGYVLVTSPEHCDPEKSPCQSLSKLGGIMAPFYATRDAFREEVEKIQHTFSL